MENAIAEIIEELDVNIVFKSYTDKDGYYIPLINTIILSSNLEEIQERCVLLHELGHAAKHQDNFILYNRLLGYHHKMESEAKEFMIGNLLTIYLSHPEVNEDGFNSIYFLNIHELDLSYEPLVKDLFIEHVNGNI